MSSPPDPFAPPRSPSQPAVALQLPGGERDVRGYHHLSTLIIASLLCSPFTAFALQALNWQRVGEYRRARWMFITSCALFYPLLILDLSLSARGLPLVSYMAFIGGTAVDHQRFLKKYPDATRKAPKVEVFLAFLCCIALFLGLGCAVGVVTDILWVLSQAN